ncbi:AcrB/AcrD/AcrF family protein [Methanococcoides orientis]|uniref:AcrB/AcrD/AcrF family protein n=1 Tax=Methanococcoides orientis TaxID=2822137 RepID=UPI001E3FE295|nr:AcrB/AcrD/AcrF family protein [Methanococcoides orientis]UGV41247.1 AcrB/AcrD/AcrF family protein [Methanococcoides orientis]
MAKSEAKGSIIMQIADILFIFVVAGICVIAPVLVLGADTGPVVFDWNPFEYFGLVAVILVFFAVILHHSLKNYIY